MNTILNTLCMETMTKSVDDTGIAIVYKVFGWMFGGLVLSALTAYWVANTPAVINYILSSKTFFIGLLIFEFLLVISLSWLINRISATVATALFLIYSIANGITLSVIVLAYTAESLSLTFFVSAAMFGVMALYGYTTGRDLSRFGSILFMGLIGLIIATLVNLFLKNSLFELIASAVGVVIFTGLTAYDIQKIKMSEPTAYDEETHSKLAIYGALILYIDFINIFLQLLRFTGRKRN